MKDRRMILTFGLCSSIVLLVIQALSQTSKSNPPTFPDPEQSQNMTEEQRKSELPKTHKQVEMEAGRRQREFQKEAAENRRQRQQKWKELAKEGRGPLADREKRWKELQEKEARIRREFLREKAALGATEEQWKLIKPRLEKVRQLCEQANSGVGLSLGGSSTDSQTNPRRGASATLPTWQWKDPWKDKSSGELTEAHKLTQQLIALVERKNAAPGTLRRTMDALRKARREEGAKLETQLSEARRELHGVLTTRQEAALVLMNGF